MDIGPAAAIIILILLILFAPAPKWFDKLEEGLAQEARRRARKGKGIQ